MSAVVAANLAWIRPGAVGGSEEYTTRLLAAVARTQPAPVELVVVAPDAVWSAHPELHDLAFRSVGGALAGRVHRLVVESSRVRRATAGVDVVHHFGGRVPARRHGNDVVTVHDLQPLDVPGNFSAAKVAYLRRALPRSVGSARRVCVPSAWVAEGVVERFGVSAELVRVVSSTWEEQATGSVDSALLDRLGERPVVLFPAITHPHKNHTTLLAAVTRLRDAHPDLLLVLTGARGRAEAAVGAAIAATDADVLRAGRVSAATLQALTARADVLAFPSRYEGFGLPVIEAMREGTPVVAAATTALPGVVGDAGLLVSPDDPAAWADAIDLVLRDGRERARLVAAGRERAAAHAPAAAAARLVDVWTELV